MIYLKAIEFRVTFPSCTFSQPPNSNRTAVIIMAVGRVNENGKHCKGVFTRVHTLRETLVFLNDYCMAGPQTPNGFGSDY